MSISANDGTTSFGNTFGPLAESKAFFSAIFASPNRSLADKGRPAPEDQASKTGPRSKTTTLPLKPRPEVQVNEYWKLELRSLKPSEEYWYT